MTVTILLTVLNLLVLACHILLWRAWVRERRLTVAANTALEGRLDEMAASSAKRVARLCEIRLRADTLNIPCQCPRCRANRAEGFAETKGVPIDPRTGRVETNAEQREKELSGNSD